MSNGQPQIHKYKAKNWGLISQEVKGNIWWFVYQNSLSHCCTWPAEGRSDLHIDRSMLWSKLHSQVAPGPPPLAWATFDMVGQLGVSSLVQEGFHWKRQCRVAGRGVRVLVVRVDRCGRTRNDDGQLFWVADPSDQSFHWLQCSWRGRTT